MRPIFVLLFLGALLGGCAAPAERETAADREIRDTLDQARESSTRPDSPPAIISDALIPQAGSVVADAAPPVEQRFDLNVDEQPARAFFMGLARGTPYNMVVHPEVDGAVSLSLKNVTIPEVMEITRDVYGYEFQATRSGFMVLPARVRTRVFEVNYLNVKRSGSSRTRVSSGQSTENPQAMQQPGVVGGAVSGGRTGAAGVGGSEPLSGSSVETESEVDFWPTLKSTLEALVGQGDGRSVVINPQTGTVVIKAMPSELREVADYIATVQDSAQRMVIIEAKVIEVELRDGHETGINWRALSPGDNPRVRAGVLRGNNLFGDSGSAEGAAVLRPGFTDPSTVNPFGGVFGVGVDTRDFDAFIELLESQGRTEVLSSPRTTAVNNQKAVIKVGSDEFFVTGIGSQTTTGAATTTGSQIQLTPFFSGIALDVTPQISADGEVILHIQPTISEVTDQTKSFTVSGREESVPLAFSSVRQSDSIVRARSGQVIVIGGLMRTSSSGESAGTPGLSRIPGVGALFRQEKRAEVKSELVILLRPIVIDDSTWNEQLREQDRRLRALRHVP